ncbi:late competence protein ComER [Caldibacillus lycopersici]|uniref:Pyrroline-5-carboxylate reductase n=1 Tax=Perspicuibacillus lycopersici TaxID=1325689 RepID=A0AAE3LMU8_9BACI|nr:late competence protein ComER [Perspicuibacillus lycopersici]MCU9613945.1 late competence protein ComER [Perspicuibacillus lycopersici]
MQIGIIGTGNMGSMLTESLIISDAIKPNNICITNRTISKALKLQAKYPEIHVHSNAEEVIQNSDLLFLCIKPLDIHPLLKKINHLLSDKKCLISITSPITVEQLESLCACSCARAIPSITNHALSGVCLLTFGKNCTEEWKNTLVELLSKISKPIEIDNEITRVASDIVSCGPAFFSYLLRKFIDSAVKETKISEELATQLASEMLIGMGNLIEKQLYTLPSLQEKVCVKGGITGEGIKVLEASDIHRSFNQLYQATHKKYQEDLDIIKEQFQIPNV